MTIVTFITRENHNEMLTVKLPSVPRKGEVININYNDIDCYCSVLLVEYRINISGPRVLIIFRYLRIEVMLENTISEEDRLKLVDSNKTVKDILKDKSLPYAWEWWLVRIEGGTRIFCMEIYRSRCLCGCNTFI